jgi:hypothetical protein
LHPVSFLFEDGFEKNINIDQKVMQDVFLKEVLFKTFLSLALAALGQGKGMLFLVQVRAVPSVGAATGHATKERLA